MYIIKLQIMNDLLKTSARRYRSDGLNTLKYKVTTVHIHPLFTRLVIDIGKIPKALRQFVAYAN